MLDTNMASYVIKGHPPEVRNHLASLPNNCIVVSVVTESELLYGVARKGYPTTITNLIKQFLLRVQVLPWDSAVAAAYGDLRASCTASGITLGALDTMIAAHAAATQSTLVTHDNAFRRIPGNRIVVEDWVL